MKTPIALICGYLGAGKTTLLNQVLTNQQGYKVAVIVNDIGEVNIDEKLIADGANITDTSSIVPLTNGCICCTLKSQLTDSIEKLIETGKYDYIMVEASGVCEPMPIAQELGLISNGILDNVIGVVDAKRLVDEFGSGEALLAEKDEEDIESLLVQQMEFCSTLVVNKVDLVSEEELKKVLAVAKAINPDVYVITTDHGKVNVGDILETGAFDFNEVYASAGWCQKLEAEEDDDDDDDDDDHDDHDHEHHHHDDHEEHEHHHHHHEHKHEGSDTDEYGISTFVYTRRKPFDRNAFDFFASHWPRNIIRSKGLMWFSDEEDMAYVFESAGRQVQAYGTGKWIATAPEEEKRQLLEQNPKIAAEWDEAVGDRIIKLCIIGKDLDKKKIIADLDICLAK